MFVMILTSCYVYGTLTLCYVWYAIPCQGWPNRSSRATCGSFTLSCDLRKYVAAHLSNSQLNVQNV